MTFKTWLSALAVTFGAAGADGPPSAAPGNGADVSAMSLEQLMDVKVVSAALHEQSATEAPASVTVITASDIRKYGYRSLAEALASVRGFYVTTDRTYSYVGARGFSLLGDFGTRYLLMINGHALPDPIYEISGFLDEQLGVEMDMVRQIEIVHGPASSLYGSGAVLFTVNVITEQPETAERFRAGIETGSFGDRKARVTGSGRIRGVQWLISTAAFNNTGEQRVGYHNSSTGADLAALNSDGRRGYHVFGEANWRNWTITGVLGSQDKQQPVSWDLTAPDRGTHVIDLRGFMEAEYKRSWANSELEARFSYDQYHYRGYYHLLIDGAVADNREYDSANWLGARLLWRTAGRLGTSTAGIEARKELQTEIHNFDAFPGGGENVHVNTSDQIGGVFFQQELDLGRNWKAVAGLRFDWSRYRDSSASPRVGLVWRPAAARTTAKLLYGRSFRNPTVYELFYRDRTSDPNPNLKPETSDTYELDLDRRLSPQFTAAVSGYDVEMRRSIAARYTSTGALQYQNVSRYRLTGFDARLSFVSARAVEGTVSAGLQNSWRESAAGRAALENSPRQVVKAQLATPMLNRRLTFSAAAQFIGRRDTMAGVSLPSAFTTELTLTSRRVGGADFQAGVRNLLDRRNLDPVALIDGVQALPGLGRVFFVRASWGTGN